MSEKLVTGEMRRLPGLTPHVEPHEVPARGRPLERGTGMRIEPGMMAQVGSSVPTEVYHPVARRQGGRQSQ